MSLPISVVIRTLNEEKNILDCIEFCRQNNPTEIIVVDGGSSDRTIEILKGIRGIKLIQSEKGLARQRDQGILNACSESEYIAVVDADDRLDENCLFNLYHDLESTGAAAAQARHESFSQVSGRKMNYWENAMLVNMKVIRDIDSRNAAKVNMIGRPALYRKDALLNIINHAAYKFTTAAEDADLSYKLIQNGAVFTLGTGITYRKHLSTFGELFKRWLSYGSGDAKFIKAHPERLFKVLKHQLYVYPIKRAFYCAFKYNIRYAPFFMLQGWTRFLGLLKYNIFGIGKVDEYKKARNYG